MHLNVLFSHTTTSHNTEQLMITTTHVNRFFFRETTARMDSLKFNKFKSLSEDVQTRFEELSQAMLGDIRNKIAAQRVNLESIKQKITELYTSGSYMLNYMLFNVQKNFIRARESMEERTLGYLAMGFQDFSYQVCFFLCQTRYDANKYLVSFLCNINTYFLAIINVTER